MPSSCAHRGLERHYVAYRAPAPALQDLAVGRIDALMPPLVAALPQAQPGRLHLLGVANPVRSPAAPEVPTAAEAGFPEPTFEGRLGFFGPRAMPSELRERIAAGIRAVAADPVFGERLQGLGMVARADTPAEFGAHIEAIPAHWAAVARAYGPGPPRWAGTAMGPDHRPRSGGLSQVCGTAQTKRVSLCIHHF